MKTLYIECNMGAAGDMLMAALSELLPDPEAFIARMNALGLPGVRFERQKTEKCGIIGTHIAVTVNGEDEHSHDVAGTENRYGGHGHSHDHGQHHGHLHDDAEANNPQLHEHVHEHEHEYHHHHASLHDICAIIEALDLRKPIYRQVAAYGHMGRTDLDVSWEKTDKAEILRKAAESLG